MMNSMGYAPVECLHVPKILFRDPECRCQSITIASRNGEFQEKN